MIEFNEFPKIARLSRGCTITEKLDGTNSAVVIALATGNLPELPIFGGCNGLVFAAQSRNRFITPADDNFGFARWVSENMAELSRLGEGAHFGEWWGAGVGRRYGQTEKRFSLFNTARWKAPEDRPTCCDMVPILYEGIFTTEAVQSALDGLKKNGSSAAPGFMNPEGVIVWHEAARTYFKKTLDKDDEWKGKAK